MTASSKPAERLALRSLILSVVFFVITFLIGRWSHFFAVSAVGWMLGVGVFIWLVLVIQFHTRSLAEQEKLDMSQLAKDKESTTIFQTKGRSAELFAVVQRRLQLFEKWFLPGFSVIIAVYQIGIGWYLLKGVRVEGVYEPKQPLPCAVFMAAVAFISFLISRYATGMSASSDAPGWKPLRAWYSCFVLCDGCCAGVCAV